MVWNVTQEVQVFPKDFHPNVGCQLISAISSSLTRGWDNKCHQLVECLVGMKSYRPGVLARHMIARPALSSNQQWGLNRFVNFPGDFLCLDDLVVESGWIRFGGWRGETKHPFHSASFTESDYPPEACRRGQCQPDQQQTNLPPSLITRALCLMWRINTASEGASLLPGALRSSLSPEG